MRPVGDEHAPLRLYLRSRRTWMGLAITAALCMILPFVGAFLVPVPSEGADGGVTNVPAWRILTVGATFGPILFCHSPFGEMEAATGRNWRRIEARVLTVNAIASAAAVTATCWAVFGGSVALLILRGVVGWMGVTLLTGKLFGWKMAWVGPLALLPIVIFWGYEYPDYRWWEFTARPVDDPTAWAVAVGLTAIGTIAYAGNRWRWRYLATQFGRRRQVQHRASGCGPGV